jgi:hypothetical protein
MCLLTLFKGSCTLHYKFRPTLVVIRSLNLLIETALLLFCGSNIWWIVPSMRFIFHGVGCLFLLCCVSGVQIHSVGCVFLLCWVSGVYIHGVRCPFLLCCVWCLDTWYWASSCCVACLVSRYMVFCICSCCVVCLVSTYIVLGDSSCSVVCLVSRYTCLFLLCCVSGV